ncbi:MAG TPA: extracellular solute-binding protein [Spirochaetia bacterium]|nr:extracellular solute-binding protein [Spirochaetia bacterium]
MGQIRRWVLVAAVVVLAAGFSFAQSDSGKVKISFIHFFKQDDPNADANNKTFYQMFARFRAANPGVDFDVEDMVHDTYETKMKTLAAGNEMPDLFLIKGSWIDNFISNGLVKPVNAMLDSNPGWRDNFNAGAFDEFKRNGSDIYGIPFQLFSTHLVLYNSAVFAKAGIKTFPKTWKEFESAIAALKAKGYTPISLGNKAKWVAESCILSTLGDRFTGSAWFYSVRDRKGAKFTDPDFVKALDAFQALAKTGAFNSDLNSIDDNQQKTLYINGKSAMFMDGAWSIPVLISIAPPDVVKSTHLAVLPSVPGGKGDPNSASGGSGWGYAINASVTPEKEKAIGKLIAALTGAEAARATIENNGQPAGRTASYDKSKVAPLSNEYFSLVSKLKFTPIYDIQLNAPIIEVMNSGLQELLIGAVSPQQLAARIQAEYEQQ